MIGMYKVTTADGDVGEDFSAADVASLLHHIWCYARMADASAAWGDGVKVQGPDGVDLTRRELFALDGGE